MAERDRIRWRCRRGLLELDLILQGFLAAEYERLDDVEHAVFSRLLDSDDNELWSWVSGRSSPSDPAYAGLVERLSAVRIGAGRTGME